MTKWKLLAIAIVGILCVLLGIYGVSHNNNNNGYSDSTNTDGYNDTVTEDEVEFGSYNDVEISEEQVVEKYFNEIQEMIIDKDYNAIDLILDRNYDEYKTLNSDEIKSVIGSKGFMGKELEIMSYRNEKKEGLNNVYIIESKVKDESINVTITINETSPNVYLISFK